MFWSRNDMGNKFYQPSRLKAGKHWGQWDRSHFSQPVLEGSALTSSRMMFCVCLLCSAAKWEKDWSRLSASSSVSTALQPRSVQRQLCIQQMLWVPQHQKQNPKKWKQEAASTRDNPQGHPWWRALRQLWFYTRKFIPKTSGAAKPCQPGHPEWHFTLCHT